MIGRERAAGAVVIVHLLAEVEHTVRESIVEKAEREPRFRPTGNIKGDMLVERVGRPRAL